jgi:hypothetical protein
VLHDSNVNGPVAGLWSSSNPFHSPRRETLYSLPYPLRLSGTSDPAAGVSTSRPAARRKAGSFCLHSTAHTMVNTRC